MSNDLKREALKRLPENTDPDTIVRVIRTGDAGHPGADLRVELSTGTILFLRPPDYDPADHVVEVSEDEGPKPVGAAVMIGHLEREIRNGNIDTSDVDLSNLSQADIAKLANRAGLELAGSATEVPATVGATIGPDVSVDDLDELTVKDLKALADAEGHDRTGLRKKAELIGAITEGRSSAATDDDAQGGEDDSSEDDDS